MSLITQMATHHTELYRETRQKTSFGVAHTHYDTSGASKDINVIFPYELMKELEAQV